VLDDESRQLLRGGAPVHLEPKAFELLLLLLRERPRALSKQAIHRGVWPDTHVSESSLAGLILDLRVAVGDDPAEPRFIRTVRGFGYAFCSATSEERAAEAGAPAKVERAVRWPRDPAARRLARDRARRGVPDPALVRARLATPRAPRRGVGRRHGRGPGEPQRHLGRRQAPRRPRRARAGAEIRVVNETILLLSAGPEVPTLTDDGRPSSE